MGARQTPLSSRSNPFVGPRPMKTGEKIFGRERETNLLLSLLVAERVLLLHSPSGAGKTSLIQAALIPRLQARRFQVLPVIRLNKVAQNGANGGASNRYVLSVLSSLDNALPEEQRLPEEELAGLEMVQYLQHLPAPVFSQEQLSGAASPSAELPTVFIFDQFEEILTLDPTDQEAKHEFFVQLGRVLSDPNRWALFAMREDYLPALDPYQIEVPTRFKNTFRLDLLQELAARQAIQKTSDLGGVDFLDAACDKLIGDLCRVKVQQPSGKMVDQPGPYIEPVQLQVVCRRLWERLSADATRITQDDITSAGDVDQSLAAYYAERVAAIARQVQIPERAIRDWFQYHLITEQGIRGLVLMSAEASQGLNNDAIRLLEDAHLIRSEKRAGATWFELAHDRLVEPVRRDNLEWFAGHLSLLQRQAELWERNKRPDSLLLRDQTLKEAQQWAQAHSQELVQTEIDFLQASQETQAQVERQLLLEAEKQRAEERAMAEQQRAEERAHTARRLRSLLMVVAVLALTALILAGVAYRAQLTANDSASQAISARATADFNALQAVQARATSDFNAEQARIAQATSDFNAGKADLARATADFNALQAGSAQTTSEAFARMAQQSEILAKQSEILARASRLAALSASYTDRNPELSFLLAIESFNVAPSLESRNALLTSLQNHRNATHEFLRRIRDENSLVTCVALSPDGQWLAWGNQLGQVVVRDLQNQSISLPAKISSAAINQILFQPESQTLVALAGGKLLLVDYQGREKARVPITGFISGFDLSPSGSRLAAITGSLVVIWDLPTNAKIKTLDFPGEKTFLSVAWSPDDRWLATGDTGNRILLWDTRTWTNPDKGGETEQDGFVTSLDWSLVSTNGNLKMVSGTSSGTVVVWDLEIEGVLFQDESRDYPGPIGQLSFSSDGSLLAIEIRNHSDVQLYDLANHQPLEPAIDVRGGSITGLSFSPNVGQLLFIYSTQDAIVYLHKFVSGQTLSRLIQSVSSSGFNSLGLNEAGTIQIAYLGGENQPLHVDPGGQQSWINTETQDASTSAFSQDGRSLAIGRKNGAIQILDLSSGGLTQPAQGHESPITALAFDSQGARLASSQCIQEIRLKDGGILCEQSAIQLWDATTLTQLGPQIEFQNQTIRALAFQPGADLLVLGGDNQISVYDLKDRQATNLVLEGHTGNVTSLVFSPDGSLLASADNQQAIFLWDTRSYQPVGNRLFGALGSVLGLAFRRDGKELYSLDSQGNLQAWNTDPDQWKEFLCDLARRNFTLTEWKQFFSDQSYQRTCLKFP